MAESEKEKINKINKLYKDGDITRNEAEEMRESIILKTKPSKTLPITEISDRELAERQYRHIRTLSDNVASIKGWIIFWSIVSILSAVLFIALGLS